MFKRKWLVIGLIIVMVMIGICGYFAFLNFGGSDFDPMMPPNEDEFYFEEGDLSGLDSLRQPIRPASDIVRIRATGNIELQERETLVSSIEALINQVHVKIGDSVAVGDTLVEFDTSKLERQVEEARFNMLRSQSELRKLLKPADSDEVAAAEQKVLIARRELQTVQAGPTAVDLKVAETDAFVAWAKYNDLIAGKTEDELATQRIALRQAERKLQRAQEAYDSISWRSNFPLAETNARELEAATDAYESAKASYNEATKPTTERALREQHSSALQAQKKLDDLRKKPEKKDITEAVLKLMEAQKELKKLTDGPDEDKVTEAKMDIQQKVLLLLDAEARLKNAKLTAPFAGTVVTIDAQVGKTAEVNSKMVTLANLKAFKLTVKVPEAKINQLHLNQPVAIALDAVPDRTFSGQVTYISPISTNSESAGGVVSYDVTIQLEINGLEGVRSGMTAVVTFINESMEDAWLVPTTSIYQENGEAMITVYRDDEPITIKVEPGLERGEWTVVDTRELQAGDEVEAGFSSFLDGGGMFGGEVEFEDESY